MLYTESDKRALCFARYYHVSRVAWTANLISKIRIEDGDIIDLNKVYQLAWAHDLNRWPFAHNVEKNLFNQAENLPKYFKANGLEFDSDELSDLQGIISKNHDNISKEAKIVLLGDIITGFIEDFLWMTTALDFVPTFIPNHIADYLCIDIGNINFVKKLFDLNYLFDTTKTVEPFKKKFDSFFQEIISKFLLKSKLATSLPLGKKEFEDWRYLIKEDFMIKNIFSYNNNKISQGKLIRTEIIEPLYKKLGLGAELLLTTINEVQAIELAKDFGIINDSDLSKYWPRLDYVKIHEPENSFRLNSKMFLDEDE